MADDALQILAFRGVELHLDARHFPVLFATWFGSISVEAVEGYMAWLSSMATRAKAEGTKMAVLGDTTQALRPSPAVRRAMASAIERLGEHHSEELLGVSTIMHRPLMRAVLIMVLTLSHRAIDLKPVKDLEAGFRRTRELLDAAGVPWPEGLDLQTYRRPKRQR